MHRDLELRGLAFERGGRNEHVAGDLMGLVGRTADVVGRLGQIFRAGRDLGDADLDSDSDAAGTGERGAAGRDVPAFDADRRPDRIEPAPDMDGELAEELDDLADDATATDGQADGDLPFPQAGDDTGSDGVSSRLRRR